MEDLLEIKISLATKIIKAAVKKWPNKIVVAFKGGKDSMVILDILKKENIGIPLLFIDHGLHFKETYNFIDIVKRDMGLNIYYEAEPDMLSKIKSVSTNKLKKVLPLFKVETIKYALQKYKWHAIISAIRRDENEARRNEKYFSKRDDHWRVHPLLDFTEEDIWTYIKRNKVKYNPLYDQDYRSVEDKVFTKKVNLTTSSERSGRERGKEKVMNRLRELGYF